MKAKKILFINQEMTPYLPDSPMSKLGYTLPLETQKSGREIRIFMPRWGNINERRNQLHEVIRLSGMNIVIDDTDHPLIIKVASIAAARMQVYFIDNDDLFLKRQMRCDENGQEYPDNIERAVFFARGVLETAKKLRWMPDVIHCSGWMSAVAPLYLKTVYKNEPAFASAKVVFSAFKDNLELTPPANFKAALDYKTADMAFLNQLDVDFSQPEALLQLAVRFSDGYVQMEKGAVPTLTKYIHQHLDVPVLTYPGFTKMVEKMTEFYETVCGGEPAPTE